MASACEPGEAQKFHDELRWCISQLELGLQRQDPDSRQAVETMKILKILRSPKAPLVKKRQAMRNALGDYRKKMKESEKKFLAGLRHSKFQTAVNLKTHSKSKFLRQSHSRTVEKDELGSHLSNLHLQQSFSEGPKSSAPDHDCMCEIKNYSLQSERIISNEDITFLNGETCDISGIAQNFSTGTVSAPMTGSVNKVKADVLQGHQMSDSNVQNRSPKIVSKSFKFGNAFHFVPSDNSFCFGFSNNDEIDIEKLNDKGDNAKNMKSTGKDTLHSILKVNNSDEIHANDKVKPNVYKYEKTDNSFVFNFS